MAEDLVSRLRAQSAAIDDIRRVSGCPGLSVGVFQNGRIVHTQHFGRQDATRPEPPNDDTVYFVASLLKVLTVQAVARLVTDGLLDWDVPVREYLPAFQQRKDETGLKATLRDLISNRSGLPIANFYWGQQNGDALLPKSEILRMVTNLEAVKPFRTSFIYSQWNYCLIHAIVEKVSGMPFSVFVKEKITAPLGLETTTFGQPRATNIMTPHAARSDGSASSIIINTMLDSTGLTAGGGGKSTMKEILSLYIALIASYNHQVANGVDATPGSPLTQLRTIFTPHIQLGNVPLDKQAYCLGIYRSLLPANLSCASLNFPILRKQVPTFGSGISAGTEIFHHTSNIPGFFGSMFLVPKTHSGVVCLTNATPLMDPTDFSAQILLATLLGENPPPNLLSLAKTAAKTQIGWYTQLSSYLEENRTDVPPTHPLEAYAGTYINRVQNFNLEVVPNATGLHLVVQGSKITTYDLMPWDGDTFYWKADRDFELCDKGMWPIPLPQWHLITFGVSSGGVESLEWHHDPLGEAETFTKQRSLHSKL